MLQKSKNIFTILALSIIPTLLVWMPFFLRLPSFWNIPLPKDGLQTIVSNYDGPLYIAVAKSLYSQEYIKENFSFPLPYEYYAAHFPLYPLIIRLIAQVTYYPYAMLIATSLGSFISIYFFNKLAKEYVKDEDALWLTILFSFFPARWLIVKSVGSPEPIFLGSIIASIYYFKNRKYFLAGLWGALAQLTKSPAILLFVAYLGAILVPNLKIMAISKFSTWKKRLDLKAYPVFAIPVSLLSVFFLYSKTFGNFFAYFNSGDNIHIFFPPFQIFNYSAPWVNTHWLEEVIFIYMLIAFGIINLIKQKDNILTWFVGTFFISILFVSHRDLIRYALPVVPFLFISFRDVLIKKEAKIVFLVLLIPIFLFSLAFISRNTMPISNWAPLL